MFKYFLTSFLCFVLGNWGCQINDLQLESTMLQFTIMKSEGKLVLEELIHLSSDQDIFCVIKKYIFLPAFAVFNCFCCIPILPLISDNWSISSTTKIYVRCLPFCFTPNTSLPSHYLSLPFSTLLCALGRLTFMGCVHGFAYPQPSGWFYQMGGVGKILENERRLNLRCLLLWCPHAHGLTPSP